jgi:hypothetical protein
MRIVASCHLLLYVILVRFSARENDFSLLLKSKHRLWDPPILQFSGYQGRKVEQLYLAPLWIISGATALSVCVFKACERKNRFRFNSSFYLDLRRWWIQINHQPDATIFQFIILTFIYSSTTFGRFPAHHQELSDCSGSLWFFLRIVVTVVLCSWSGRLLMMGGKTPRNMLSCKQTSG